MRSAFTCAIVVLVMLVAFSASLWAQGAYQNTQYDKLNTGPGGAAPKRDFSGCCSTWTSLEILQVRASRRPSSGNLIEVNLASSAADPCAPGLPFPWPAPNK
jgi:hypothetical protein